MNSEATTLFISLCSCCWILGSAESFNYFNQILYHFDVRNINHVVCAPLLEWKAKRTSWVSESKSGVMLLLLYFTELVFNWLGWWCGVEGGMAFILFFTVICYFSAREFLFYKVVECAVNLRNIFANVIIPWRRTHKM